MGHRAGLDENEARLVGDKGQPSDEGNAVLSGWHDMRACLGRAMVGLPNGGYNHDSREPLGEWQWLPPDRLQEGHHLVMPGKDKLEWRSNMNAKVKKGMSSSKEKQRQVKSLYALTMVPKAPDKRGVVNVSSKQQVEHLPVDDNNDNSDEDGSGPPSDEEEDVVDRPPSKPCACITSTKHGFHEGTLDVPTQWALIGELDAYRDKGAC